MLSSGSGYNGQYVGYYNAFNIAASGNSTSAILTNALAYAQKKGWNSLEASINGGISFLAQQYIQKGQDTLYFQKFDVEATNGLYSNQYMQNILAAQNEGTTLRNTYINMNSMSLSHTFIIPVYENMPSDPCSRPNTNGTSSTDTDLVKINVDSTLRIRNNPNGDTTVGWLYKDEIVTRLEKATSKVAGTYWDKIQKSDGTVGYVARETYESESKYKLYLVPISDNSTNNSNSENNTNNEESNTSNNVNYKLGDCNNDGTINSGDLLVLKKHLIGSSIVTDENILKAMDVNNDGTINSGDLLLIRKFLLGTYTIE